MKRDAAKQARKRQLRQGVSEGSQNPPVILSASEGSRKVTLAVLFTGFFVAALLRMTGGRERAALHPALKYHRAVQNDRLTEKTLGALGLYKVPVHQSLPLRGRWLRTGGDERGPTAGVKNRTSVRSTHPAPYSRMRQQSIPLRWSPLQSRCARQLPLRGSHCSAVSVGPQGRGFPAREGQLMRPFCGCVFRSGGRRRAPGRYRQGCTDSGFPGTPKRPPAWPPPAPPRP